MFKYNLKEVYLDPQEILNIVFKIGTPYVRKDEVSSLSSFVKPYTLENVSAYSVTEDNILNIKFRPFYISEEKYSTQHSGGFEMKYIDRVFISKSA